MSRMASAMAAPVSPSQSSGSSNSKDELAAMLEAELESAWAQEDAEEGAGEGETRDWESGGEEPADRQQKGSGGQIPDDDERSDAPRENESQAGQLRPTSHASNPLEAGATESDGQRREQEAAAAPAMASGTKRSRGKAALGCSVLV